MTMWIKDPQKWESLELYEKLKLLRRHYCRGSAFETMGEVLKEAMELIEDLEDKAWEMDFYDCS
jgi:predicted DNA-binding protein